MTRALFSLCRMSKTEALITFFVMHHNFVCSTALPSAASPFQLTQAKITQWCLLPWGSPFISEMWLMLWTQWRRRSWIWGWVMHHQLEGRRRGMGETPSLPWLDHTGTRVLGLVSALSLLHTKTACVFHFYQSSISCQLKAFPFFKKTRFDHSLLGLSKLASICSIWTGGENTDPGLVKKGKGTRYQVVMWETKPRKTTS